MKLSYRQRARKFALQAIYSLELSGNKISDIELEMLSSKNKSKIDKEYFHELVIGVSNNIATIDNIVYPFISKKINQLGQIEKAVLRLAIFELNFRHEIPYKVIINEAIELVKIFGSEKSYKFINGVLDKVAIFLLKK
ncbi:MAG: transcription antitermination factor NusB [Arsenophonus sp.]|nr:MAG: transcription antitermination factor NusB [Arsenophonus sp.]